MHSNCRPDIAASFIRQPIKATGGETIVAVYGGKSLVAMIRNVVATYSVERAWRRGTEAQGIRLHVDEYCL